MATGLNIAFKLSGNSVQPTYFGFIVIKTEKYGDILMYVPRNSHDDDCLDFSENKVRSY